MDLGHSVVSQPSRQASPSGRAYRNRLPPSTGNGKPLHERADAFALPPLVAEATGERCPSVLSSSVCRRVRQLLRCHPETERAPTALQGTSPGLPPHSLLAPHSHSQAVQSRRPSRRRTGNHPGRLRASCVSHRLRRLSLVASRCDPAFDSGTSLRQKAAVSGQLALADFWEANVEALPYPPRIAVRSSASTLKRLTPKRSPAFPG